MESRDVYDNRRMAWAYAFDRPPVHPHIIRALRTRLGLDARVGRALDVGCGAGVSTAALETVARATVGLEPAPAMLTHCRTVAPGAAFVVGRAERLPFTAGSFDLVTAAGSLNYVDLPLFLAGLVRVLAPEGILAIYDFSAGRRLLDDNRLDAWYAAFERRYPPKPGYDLDVRALPFDRFGLRLDRLDALEVAVPMTFASYLRYVMSESGVQTAISQGAEEAGIRRWCESTLAGVLDDTPRDVLFDAYVGYVARG